MNYRFFFYALDIDPPKPGLVRVNGEDGDGGAIEIEVWALAPEAFASFVDAVPAPLVIGRVVLADGSDVAGFLCESIAVRGATDITIGEKIDRHRAIARWRRRAHIGSHTVRAAQELRTLGGEMALAVVGAGVGRTGTHSLKIALEQLLGGPCHHMLEVLGDPSQMPGWIDAIEGRPVDWSKLLENYRAIVDWPGGSFWPELLEANPDALVLLSVRDSPEEWFRSADRTIFQTFDQMPPEAKPWMNAVRQLLHDRFSDQLDDPAAMIDAYERHNERVRQEVPASQLLEWRPSDGWEPICERLELPVPAEPFPVTNTTDEFRAMIGMPPLAAT